MSDRAILQFLLSTDGVNQLERSQLSLDPTAVRIDPRSKRDLLRFLLELGEQVRFYDLDDRPQGDWRRFLDMLTAGGEVLDEAALDRLLVSRQDWPAHLALLMAFLRVFGYAQADMNRLPARRLNFHYQDVLAVRRRPVAADQVHVLFELAKNAPDTLLAKGTLLKAGTTADGVPLTYALDSDHLISHARLASSLSSFADRGTTGERIVFRSTDATRRLGSESGWRPFGSPQLRSSELLSPMEHAAIGCAVASPNLFLAEGRRTVTVRMRLKSRVGLAGVFHLRNAVDIRITGEGGWIAPDSLLHAHISPEPPAEPEPKEFGSTLSVSVLYNEGAPPITAYDEAAHQASLQSPWPVWSLTLQPDASLLDFLGQFAVAEVEIDVEARGLRDLVLQNDQSLQPPDAPVLPFGGFPRIGSNFYIGSAEAFTKSLTSLAVNLEWQDPPASLAAHYTGYDNPNINNGVFLGELYLLAGRKWQLLTPSSQTLFNTGDPRTLKTIAVTPPVLAQQIAYTSYRRQPDLAPPASFGHTTTQGFLRLELIGPIRADLNNLPADAPFEAFGHKSFPTVYARRALEIGQGGTGVLPQPPYTPTLATVTVDYTASERFRPDNPNRFDQFFLLDVFGAADAAALRSVGLVPQHPHQAALYLGLENASAPQLLSLLFQFEEGSAPGAELLRSEEIAWHYLAGSEWRQISRNDVLEDRTDGFQVPGLVRLLLPADATREHTRMPPRLHWLRASVMSRADGAASVLDIQGQAARATLQIPAGREHALDGHLSAPLPVNAVSALANRVAPVKKVRQPYPSSAGRPSESDTDFHRRVHERLRHRNRAVSGGDYERLVLEAFPGIFKVKCLPHSDADNALAPGDVKLVVVPDWRKRATGNPLTPRANRAFLRSVEDLLAETHTSPFSAVRVSNPVYEALLVDARVRFRPGFDPGFHAALLGEEIQRFLSPWAFEEGVDIVFGGKIHASEILAFVEGRPYVENVTDFELYHQYRGDPGGGIGEMQIGTDFVVALTPDPSVGGAGIGKQIGTDFVIGLPVEAAAATRPDAILVSSRSHRIGVLSADGEVCEGTQSIGIGQMIVGLDFLVVT
jgi:hypothetical protein